MAEHRLSLFLKIIILFHLTVIAWFFNQIFNHYLFRYEVYNQEKKLTEIQVSYAKEVEAYFDGHLKFVNSLANSPIFDGYDSQKFMPKLKLLGEAEKRFIRIFVVNADGTYYTADNPGNIYMGGLHSLDNSDPKSPLKNTKKRHYWQKLMRDNVDNKYMTYVTAPLIAYVSEYRLVLVLATIIRDGKVKGLVGGGVEWNEFDKFIKRLNESYKLDDSYWPSVIHRSGAFWYHFDNRKKLVPISDQDGNQIYDQFGNVLVVNDYIQYDKNDQFAQIGRKLVKGERGVSEFRYEGNHLICSYGPIDKIEDYSMLMAKVVSKPNGHYFFTLLIIMNFFIVGHIYRFLRKYI